MLSQRLHDHSERRKCFPLPINTNTTGRDGGGKKKAKPAKGKKPRNRRTKTLETHTGEPRTSKKKPRTIHEEQGDERKRTKKQRKNKRTTQEHTKEPKQSFGRSSITPPSAKSESKPGEQTRRRAREQERKD